MLFSASLVATFGLFSVAAAQATQDPLAASSCYLTCATYDPTVLAGVCNVAFNETKALDACFCTNQGLRDQFSACLDKTCPEQKDATLDINETLCKSDDKTTSDSVECIQTCGKTLGPQVDSVCTDPKTVDECSCTNQSVRDSLKECVSSTCADLSKTALTYSDVLCSLNGFNLTIPIDISHNQTIPIDTGSAGNGTSPSAGESPAQNGTTPGGDGSDDGDNSATALSIGGYASLLLVAAALVF